jgi:signal transduction histidine kinase/CheY-like chemotaxis protein
MHPLLARQFRKVHAAHTDADDVLAALLQVVSDAYCAADEDRMQLERSLGIASEEMLERNRRLESDLEERKGLQKELLEAIRLAQEMARAAAAANRAKSDFLANMSHEIRTPMNGVIGMTELLLDTPLNDLQREHAKTIADSAASLLVVINDILDFSKIEAGKLEIECHDVSLQDIVHDVRRMLLLQATPKGVTVTANIDTRLPAFIVADAVRLRQVLLNLAGNAVKFTKRGSVTIGVKVLDIDALGTRIRCEVRDTGIGIPSDRIAMLFNPFTQADSSTTRQFGGTGLGLSIARQLVELMGGEIGVESKVGKGSIFWFNAHFAKSERSAGESVLSRMGVAVQDVMSRPSVAVPTELPSGGMRRILVADDNPVNQKVAQHMLKKLGYAVDLVTNGSAAVTAWQDGQYELILMDCQMPILDGYEATREIRRRENGQRHTPIIALTAHAMKGAEGPCITAGMDAYLTKPINRIALQETIAQLLSKSA